MPWRSADAESHVWTSATERENTFPISGLYIHIYTHAHRHTHTHRNRASCWHRSGYCALPHWGIAFARACAWPENLLATAPIYRGISTRATHVKIIRVLQPNSYRSFCERARVLVLMFDHGQSGGFSNVINNNCYYKLYIGDEHHKGFIHRVVNNGYKRILWNKWIKLKRETW